MTSMLTTSFPICDHRGTPPPGEALELVSAVISLWFVGLVLAILLGRAAPYVARTRQLIQSPFRMTLRYIASIAHWSMAAARRLGRIVVVWLWRRLWKW